MCDFVGKERTPEVFFTLIKCTNAVRTHAIARKREVSIHILSFKMRSGAVETAHFGVLHVNTVRFAYVYRRSLHISSGFFFPFEHEIIKCYHAEADY